MFAPLFVNSSFPIRFRVLVLACVAWLLTVCPIHADTYAQWAARVFTAQEQSNPNISGENANPAKDGVSNLMKFAFDLDPHKNGVPGLPTVGTVLGYNYETEQNDIPLVALTYRYPSTYSPDNITYLPEVSGDLRAPNGWMHGSNIIQYFNYQHPQNAGDPYLLTYNVLSPISQNPSVFMCLRVIDGHAIPADWLQKYFGTTTGINPDADPDQDGYTT